MNYESVILSQLQSRGLNPSERLGQHILINEEALNIVAGQIDYGSNVLEIGSGPGNLTGKMADRAKKVVAVEIDQRYKPFLDELHLAHPNIEIIYQDAISLNFERIIRTGHLRADWQVASNLPFHISEPFLKKLIGIPIKNAVLMLGDLLVRRMQIEDPDSLEFTRTSLLTQTFFEPSVISHISRDQFYPQPRTDAAVVVLTPREKSKFENNPGQAILRNLFLSEKKNSSVAKVIKDSGSTEGYSAALSKSERHRRDRKQSRFQLKQLTYGYQYGGSIQVYRREGTRNVDLERLNLPNELLSKPFSRLDTQDIRVLAKALKKRYG